MSKDGSKDSRRRFLLQAATLGPLAGAASLIATRANADEPFDSLPAHLWKNARQNGLIMIHRPTPTGLTWRTQIVTNREPGEPLIVSGQVVAPDASTPAAGVTVYAYNTDAQGYYGENRTEYPPRLYGWMKTDPAGRFELRTIHPGHYPDMQVPSHVHLEMWGGGYPLQWAEGLQFAGDRYLTADMLAQDAQLGEFRTIQPLTKGDDGTLRCQLKIRMKTETTFR